MGDSSRLVANGFESRIYEIEEKAVDEDFLFAEGHIRRCFGEWEGKFRGVEEGETGMPPFRRSDHRRRGGDFRLLRGALGAGGAFPGGELVGGAAVFVLDGGVEAGDDGLGVAEEGVDG